MSTARIYEPRYTVADYQQWRGDWELLRGYPVAMTPSPFGAHQSVAARLIIELGTQLQSNDSCPCEVLHEIDWIIGDDTVVRPDIIVVCGKVPEKHIQTTPALVVEVLSKSTRALDLGAKRDLYYEQHVPVYLIVDPESKSAQVLVWSADGWQDIVAGDDGVIGFSVGETCEIRLDPRRLFR